MLAAGLTAVGLTNLMLLVNVQFLHMCHPNDQFSSGFCCVWLFLLFALPNGSAPETQATIEESLHIWELRIDSLLQLYLLDFEQTHILLNVYPTLFIPQWWALKLVCFIFVLFWFSLLCSGVSVGNLAHFFNSRYSPAWSLVTQSYEPLSWLYITHSYISITVIGFLAAAIVFLNFSVTQGHGLSYTGENVGGHLWALWFAYPSYPFLYLFPLILSFCCCSLSCMKLLNLDISISLIPLSKAWAERVIFVLLQVLG